MTPSIITSYAPAASDFRGNEGKIVVRSAIASGKTRVALATAASAQAFGVINTVGIELLGQTLGICQLGPCFVKLGAGWTIGTTEPCFMSDANGDAIPATAGSRYVGRLVLNDLANLAAGNIAEAIVLPGELET